MSTITILEIIKDFLLKKVTPNIKLQKADDSNVKNYELVNPGVYIGWIPPKGYLPEDKESAIPCLIVGMDQGTDDGEKTSIDVRISAVVYSPGLHASDGQYTPDFQGYIDLLNLIDRTIAELYKNQIISKGVVIDSEIRWGMYQEQPYPYWYGWITFSVRNQSYPRSEILKDLL